MFYCRIVALCFVVDLLQQVVVSSTVSFFVGFRVGNSDGKVDPIELSDQIMFVSML